MSFQLPSLPYDYQALEPHVDTQTMNIHHKMHHQTYVTKLNAALQEKDKDAKDLVALQHNAIEMGTAIRNNGGGHYNHSLFWKWMTGVGSSNTKPFGELATKIDESFGAFEAFQTQFNDVAAARFGSGWAWLCVKSDGTLGITSTANQDNPLMKGAAEEVMVPILGLDVWEHAYYLKYQNRRPEYIQQWWNVVNWDQVVKCYEDYGKKGIAVPACGGCSASLKVV